MRPALALAGALLLAGAAFAQQPAKAPPAFPDGPGKDVLTSKCFQCHGPSMWSAQRQDRRAWEATLYRMVGRGALWNEDEIEAMASYLGTAYARKPK
jgi:mono/diheme cytochrome c family protein